MSKNIGVEILLDSNESRAKLFSLKESEGHVELLTKVKKWVTKDSAMSILSERRDLVLNIKVGSGYYEIDDDYDFHDGGTVYVKLVPNRGLLMVSKLSLSFEIKP